MKSTSLHRILINSVFWMLALSLLLISSEVLASDEVDHVALAERLYADGHLERAKQSLARFDQTNKDGDQKGFHLITGLIFLSEGQNAKAVASLERALELGETRNLAQLGLAQAYFSLERFDDALSSLRSASPRFGGTEVGYLMGAQCLWQKMRFEEALALLYEGEAHLDYPIRLRRQSVQYFVELKLFHKALGLSLDMAQRVDLTVEDSLAIAHVFKAANQPFAASEFLELTRLRFGHETKITELLAHIYLELDRPFAAAQLFETLVARGGDYAFQAAHAFKVAKRFGRALASNTKVIDASKRFKQRLSILIEDGRYLEVTAMRDTIDRLGLSADDEIQYALAYAYFKTAKPESARTLLGRIQEPKLLEQVSALRRSILDCEQAQWRCL